ncbi:unnamed protein product [Albugo candida]|uniref:Uncharacterized protein n=1 Tax=Albugo candida TaxID=65357 RepID=A0A024GD72_9STRA|nr:unnamed protein product [Albugo candida]|eukprot:CCI44638.1 unnamed protein product [Albugo candida]
MIALILHFDSLIHLFFLLFSPFVLWTQNTISCQKMDILLRQTACMISHWTSRTSYALFLGTGLLARSALYAIQKVLVRWNLVRGLMRSQYDDSKSKCDGGFDRKDISIFLGLKEHLYLFEDNLNDMPRHRVLYTARDHHSPSRNVNRCDPFATLQIAIVSFCEMELLRFRLIFLRACNTSEPVWRRYTFWINVSPLIKKTRVVFLTPLLHVARCNNKICVNE